MRVIRVNRLKPAIRKIKVWPAEARFAKKGCSANHLLETTVYRPSGQDNVAATLRAHTLLASDCRAHSGRALKEIEGMSRLTFGLTVQLPVRPRRETMYW